jgi:hypothetical protein
MASYKTSLIVMSINMYIFFSEWYNSIYNSIDKLYRYLVQYYNGLNNIWIFIAGYNMPLSINNIENSIEYTWKYNNNHNTLSYNIWNEPNPSDFNEYELAWLSSKIRIDNGNESTEYDIDNFVENFVIKTSHYLPSLKTIFMCWCIYSRLWFSTTDIVEFIIIDEMANENIININDETRQLRFKRVRVQEESNDDTEDETVIEDTLEIE